MTRLRHDAAAKTSSPRGRLLDAGRFDDWLALFADDGRYWVPLQGARRPIRSHNSLAYEDRLLLRCASSA